jgi:RNA polymerase sigma factor (sigma-70 family)
MTQEVADTVLLERWSEGDSSAGTQLLLRHRRALYRFLGGRIAYDLEDVAQQTLLACVERRDGFRGDASFRTFMLQIARYQLYAHYRMRRRVHATDVSLLEDVGPCPIQELARQQDECSLSIALERLPPIFRDVLRLAFFEELTGPKIAIKLGIPEPTVRSRTRRALLQLRREVETLNARAGGNGGGNAHTRTVHG